MAKPFEKGKSGNPATMFQKGKSGNPAGGSAAVRMSKIITAALGMSGRISFRPEELPEGMGGKPDKDGRVRVTMSYGEAFGLRMLKHAMKGKGTYARLIMEYNSGRPPQTIIHEGEIAVPLTDARNALIEALNASAAPQPKRRGTPPGS